MTYDAADLTEQAYGFVHMRDVIASAAGRDARRGRPRPGRPRPRRQPDRARASWRAQNVVLGPWGAQPKAGLLWR